MIVIPKVRLATCADALRMAQMSRDYIEGGLGWSWTPQRILASVQDAATNVAVIGEHGSIIGFAIMHYGDAVAHLALLAVHPEQRRRGRAARLLSWLEICADTAGIGRIRVEARADNPGAIAFYQRQGYQPVQRIAGYYRGVLDAVRLEKRPCDHRVDAPGGG
jgi:ribosomal protein S18 acetylase RimI-like enzyme